MSMLNVKYECSKVEKWVNHEEKCETSVVDTIRQPGVD